MPITERNDVEVPGDNIIRTFDDLTDIEKSQLKIEIIDRMLEVGGDYSKAIVRDDGTYIVTHIQLLRMMNKDAKFHDAMRTQEAFVVNFNNHWRAKTAFTGALERGEKWAVERQLENSGRHIGFIAQTQGVASPSINIDNRQIRVDGIKAIEERTGVSPDVTNRIFASIVNSNPTLLTNIIDEGMRNVTPAHKKAVEADE